VTERKLCLPRPILISLEILFVTFFLPISGLVLSQENLQGSSELGTGQKPLLVYLLVGQSNMQGHAKVSTLSAMAMDPETQKLHDKMIREDRKPRKVNDVWISYLSSSGVKQGRLTTGFGATAEKIGPELAFGIRMREIQKRPILIIKTAWGGKSLNTDFRPPSAQPFSFPEQTFQRFQKQGKDPQKLTAERREKSGVFYRKMMEHIKWVLNDPKQVVPEYNKDAGYEIGGMVWFQGWNDMVDSSIYPERGSEKGYPDYSLLLETFIKDVRKDLNQPEMPFVIGVMGVGGPTNKYSERKKRVKKIHQNFRDAMTAPVRNGNLKNVTVVLTENCWDQQLNDLVEKEGMIRGEVRRSGKKDQYKSLVDKLGEKESVQAALVEKIKDLKKKGRIEKFLVDLLMSRQFTPKEMTLLKTGKSNAAYHYLGSGKILSQIGTRFAEAFGHAENH